MYRIEIPKEKLEALREMIKISWSSSPPAFVSVILLTQLQALIPVTLAWITKLIFDLLVESLRVDPIQKVLSQLFFLLLWQLLFLLLDQGVELITAYVNSELGRKLTLKIQTSIYQKINGFVGIGHFENPDFYDTIQLGSNAVFSGSYDMVRILASLLGSITTLVSFLGILSTIDPALGILSSFVAIPQFIVQITVGRQRFEISPAVSRHMRKISYYASLLSSARAAKEIRLFHLGNYFLEKLVNGYKKTHEIQRSQEIREMRLNAILHVFSNVVSTISFIFIVYLALRNRLTIGDITLYQSSVSNVSVALASFVFIFGSLNENLLFFSHYQRLIELPQPVKITEKFISIPPLSQGIEFRKVSFRYTPTKPWVLKDFSLSLPTGKCIALVGLNGAGKTTLIKLLTRLYDPTQGQILWDGIDIRNFDPVQLRQKIGAIFQDFMQYDLLARENIGFGDIRNVDNIDAVTTAAIKAGIHDAVEKLSNGYNTLLSRQLFDDDQEGTDLSGGEWQKIAIARVFMKERDLLVLDEPTSALDVQAEYDFFNNIKKLAKNTTTLIISHRFSTVSIADRIAVVENGEVAESGTYQELLAHKKTFAKLHRMQVERYTN